MKWLITVLYVCWPVLPRWLKDWTAMHDEDEDDDYYEALGAAAIEADKKDG